MFCLNMAEGPQAFIAHLSKTLYNDNKETPKDRDDFGREQT